MTPEELGKIVRQAWVKYCKETGWRTSPDTICDWEEMTDQHAKEVDRRIGVAVARAAEAAAYQRGAERMREAAAGVADIQANRLPIRTDLEFSRSRTGENIAEDIRALPIPPDGESE